MVSQPAASDNISAALTNKKDARKKGGCFKLMNGLVGCINI
jgi:hypothetical protein